MKVRRRDRHTNGKLLISSRNTEGEAMHRIDEVSGYQVPPVQVELVDQELVGHVLTVSFYAHIGEKALRRQGSCNR